MIIDSGCGAVKYSKQDIIVVVYVSYNRSSAKIIRDDRVSDMEIDSNNNLYLTGYLQLYGTSNYLSSVVL